MRYAILLFLLPVLSFSQTGGIKIQTKDGKERFTNYVLISNGYGWSQPAYVRVDGKKGLKLPINTIHHLEGFDQKGDYRYLLPVNPKGMGLSWGERIYKSDRVELLYTDFSSTSWESTQSFKFRNFYYRNEGGSLDKMTYRNLKSDFGSIGEVEDHLKKGNKVRIAQMLMYTVGAGLIAYGSAKFLDVKESDELGDPGNTNLNLHPTIFVGAALVWVPYFLNSEKQKHFINGIKAVK